MATLSRDEARLLIGKIREENGGISPEDRAACPPAVLRALENVRRKLGAATKTLATNLYSKDTRFVYELIQNAEDNFYDRAEAAGLQPSLSFSLYPNRIVIDSNENGFQEEHVKAICSTGESTKALIQGYIGEKGIGFKSVFKVAKKVHIQSGPFSFSFEYEKDSDDDGLGMVTPLDENFDDLPHSVHTRITLTLLDSLSFEQRALDLLNIPGPTLLFLTRLRALHITIHRQDEDTTDIKYIRNQAENNNLETITKTTFCNGVQDVQTQYFHVARKQISNLPPDEARKNISQATVVLAFPVDKNETPIISQQHVFAFLPLRPVGLTFLVQSDFVTQASREDVFHSARNESLLSTVAETFRDAVLQFCRHPSLRYKWMRYLPTDSISDDFWKALAPKIVALLKTTPCLLPWETTALKLPGELYWVAQSAKDVFGQPLFRDLTEEGYLSPGYTYADFEKLKVLGTRVTTFKMVIERVRSDLNRPDSRMKSVSTDEEWHTRSAELLSVPFERSSQPLIQEIRSLDLICLQDHRWVPTRLLPIYFPKTGLISIPTDLDLDLVHDAAFLNTARKTLFSHLGVTVAEPGQIICHIIRKYSGPNSCTTSQNIEHLRYLYWNLPRDTSSLDTKIYLKTQDGHRFYRKTPLDEYIYFKEEGSLGSAELFQRAPSESPDAPGLHVQFLHEDYLPAVSSEARHHGKSWKIWLIELAAVRSYPQILNPKLRTLSNEFKYIILHQPGKLIQILKHYWHFYELEINPAVVQELRNCSVPSGETSTSCLEETFLPLPHLQEIVRRLEIVDFPFLVIPEELNDEREKDWAFLGQFGVRSRGDSDKLHFYIKALSMIGGGEYSPEFLEALFEVYEAIEKNCTSSEDVAFARSEFRSDTLIYSPPNALIDATWYKSSYCVWLGPEWLQSKARLSGIPQYAALEHLFRVILKIGDADWKDYLEDLELLNIGNEGTTYHVKEIYRRIWREFGRDSNWETIRKRFEESQLVFVPSQNTWHPLSACIWAEDRVQVPRKMSIKASYEDLEDFFCRVLDVKKPNLEMHIQALKELASHRPSPSAPEIKRMAILISSMDPSTDDVKELLLCNMFSVKLTNGQRAFTNTTADFAINDRSEYGAAFAGKIRILDYSIEEVRACRPLLLALGMKGRHLSEMVEETTTVQDGALNTELSHMFQSKAYALFRCAVHFHSHKSRDGDKSLYDKLLGASVYVSDGISKSISIVQYSETVTIENSRAKLHLDENDELRLYVPRDENDQEECFHRQLPRRLMKYLIISDPAAESLLNGIIGCRSLIAIDGILSDAGIVEVEGIVRPVQPTPETRQSDFEANLVEGSESIIAESQKSQLSRLTPVSINGTLRSAHVKVVSPKDLPQRSPSTNRESPSINGSGPSQCPSLPSPSYGSFFSIPLVEDPLPDAGYVSLLRRVIDTGARISFPISGSHSIDAVASEPPLGLLFSQSIFGSRSEDRNNKVGAAGELLIFEILLGRGLPSFNRQNWKSTIRHTVSIHDKYRGLLPWIGRETADLVYSDIDGVLTKLFIEKGYLQAETWRDARPTYFLEVKTTTRDCNEELYISGSQYKRMQKMQLEPEISASSVYVLFRVFNLEGKIGLRVFVDPESARLNGELEFSVDKWAVKTIGISTA